MPSLFWLGNMFAGFFCGFVVFYIFMPSGVLGGAGLFAVSYLMSGAVFAGRRGVRPRWRCFFATQMLWRFCLGVAGLAVACGQLVMAAGLLFAVALQRGRLPGLAVLALCRVCL